MTRETAADRVYATLRGRILSGELTSGTQLSIYRLADELGVSRTPVREAVLRLADNGLLTVERNRGITIGTTSLRDIREIFEYRLMIEVPAVTIAAVRGTTEFRARIRELADEMDAAVDAADRPRFIAADRAFHAEITRQLNNPRLSSALSGLRDATKLGWAAAGDAARPIADVNAEHRPIIEAIAARDSRAAADAMEEHLISAGTQHQERLLGGAASVSWKRRFREHLWVGAESAPTDESGHGAT
jgi:DNA-binding GntR family transcriptional regulator